MRIALPLALPLVLAIAFHAIPRLAHPLSDVSSDNGPRSDISTLPIPRSNVQLQPSATTQSSNTTSRFPPPLRSWKKYVFPIEGTGLALTISLGALLDKVRLAAFLAVTKDYVNGQRRRFGPNQGLPSGLFEYDLGDDIEISADSPASLTRHITWRILEDVIHGLQGFLVGMKNYREASCRVYAADPAGVFLGYVHVRKRSEPRQANIARSLPALVPADDDASPSALLRRFDQNIHVDIRPQWSRLDIRAVRNVLVVAEDWAREGAERFSPYQSIPNDRYEYTLFEGVQIRLIAAPSKRLSYHLALETFERLLTWEMALSKGKAVEFGILEQGVLKGAGSIKKDTRRRVDVDVA
ncbi:MAG: hypothetical protein Q9201_006222 [Fulgogasparrea decipioides]